MKRAAKIDANQRDMVQALRQAGCRVLSLAALGKGVPDLLVYRPAAGRLYLLEIKDGRLPPSRRRLTPDQTAFHALWPVALVTSVDEALIAVGGMKNVEP